jgi:hypothetical protein
LALRIEFLDSLPVPVIDVYVPFIIRIKINAVAEHVVLISFLYSYGKLFLEHDSELYAVFWGGSFGIGDDFDFLRNLNTGTFFPEYLVIRKYEKQKDKTEKSQP